MSEVDCESKLSDSRREAQVIVRLLARFATRNLEILATRYEFMSYLEVS